MAPSPEVVQRLWPEWERAAIHEAGHAVVAVMQGIEVEFARLYYHGSGRWTEVRGVVRRGRCDLRDTRAADAAVLIAFAGPAAEALWLRRHDGAGDGAAQRAADESSGDDLVNVRAYLRCSSLTHSEGRREALRMVTRHWSGIQRTARALARRGRLPGSAVRTS